MELRTLAVFLLIASSARAAWPNVEFTEVRGYVYNSKNELIQQLKTGRAVNMGIVQNGTLAPTVVNKSGALLNSDQVRRLLGAVNGKHPDHIRARCWNPHHGFVFYNSQHRAIGSVTICFECSNIEKEPEDRTHRSEDMEALLQICKELKLPISFK